MKEKACHFMTKIANLLSAKAEMGAPMICMYLLGIPDHYTSHSFVLLYWQMYVVEVRQQFDTIGDLQPQKVMSCFKPLVCFFILFLSHLTLIKCVL